MNGHASEEQTIEVGQSRQTLSFRLSPISRLEVRAADSSASGATLRVDGDILGTVPSSPTIEPGRHQVSIEREGFEPFAQWVELNSGQTITLNVSLTAITLEQGTLLIAGAVSGAQVSVDGRPRGNTPAIVEIEPGQHLVEVRAEGYEPFSQTVTVAPGARVTLDPTLVEESPPGGSLRVLFRTPSAVIWIDGESRGPAPVTVEGLVPGTHIVEARVDGRPVAIQRVTIEEGRRETIMLEVDSNPASAPTPAVVTTPPAAGGMTSRFPAPLPAAGQAGRLTVVSSTSGAEVLIDGALIGIAPVRDHRLAAGTHTIEVRATGHRRFTTTVDVTEGLVQQINADLVADPGSGLGSASDDRSDEERDRRRSRRERDDDDDDEADQGDDEDEDDEANENRRRFVQSAIPLQPYKLAIDASWGWPYLIGDYQLTLGVHRNVDVALAVRSNSYYTEIDGHVRVGVRLARVIGLSGELYIGGGFGDLDRSAFVFGVTFRQGLEFDNWTITLRERLHIFSDTIALDTTADDNVLLFLGAAFEYSFSRWLHMFAIFDYAPAQNPRLVLCGGPIDSGGESCGHWMPGEDVTIEARIGLGLRFF
jgi:hypothetical protein